MKKNMGIALGLCSVLFGCAQWRSAPMVNIDSGAVQGINEQTVDAFKGIPYAAPPVGNLRWRAPQPVTAWHSVLKATAYGHDCMQKPFPGDAAPLGTPPSEDCLVLNVWKPHQAKTGSNKPVMVWIYGGGFVNGGSSPSVYDASSFARQDIVAVSFNYRVGRFGFFAHPALSAENKDGMLGNYGFMDQIAALHWVQRNIAQFGGDPNNVTLVGESAGGFSIHTLLTSPLAKGLFHQAIIQSGSGRKNITQRNLHTVSASGLPSAEAVGVAFAKQHGVSGGNNAQVMQQLRALSAAEVTSGLNMASMQDPTYAGPMIDGKLALQDPEAYYSAGQDLNIPLLVGSTTFEIGFAPQVSDDRQALTPLGSGHFEQKLAAYKASGVSEPQAIAQAIASDILMVEPARFVMRQAARQHAPVYGYRFGYVADSIKDSVPGAPHATDIPYAFATVSRRYEDKTTSADKQMVALVHQYWVNFIKHGDPNGQGLPQWQAYQPAKDNIMWFSNQGAAASHMVRDPWQSRLDYVEKIQ